MSENKENYLNKNKFWYTKSAVLKESYCNIFSI